MTRTRGPSPDDDPTHARHETDHPEWARFRRPGDEPLAVDAADATADSSPVSSPAGDAARPADPATLVAAEPGPPAVTRPESDARGTGSWVPPATIDAALEPRIRRDLRRGRRIVWLTWVAALASLVLGLVAIRQAALLVAVDRTIVTTEEVQAASATFDVARAVLVLTVVIGTILVIRWLRDALPVREDLRRLGVVDGSEPGPGIRRLASLWHPSGVPADRAGWADLRVGSGRRLAVFALVVVALAAVVGVVAAIWLGAARDAEMSRALRIVSGVDGVLWLIASVLVGATFDAILWREAAAARALGVFIPLVDAPSRTLVRLIPPLLLFGAGVLIASGRPDPWFVPCPSSTLLCDGMLVPVDHDGGGSTATIWIVYATHRASEQPIGTLAIAVGGPGASGLDEATAIVDTLDPQLVLRYDLLFFDQRGIGASEGADCPRAGLAYATVEPSDASARAFAAACVREAAIDPSTLARYATRQAAADLDSIRDRLGIDRLVLYGESYGTELAQAYAALHPERLTGLILDGPVDLTRTANEFWSDAAHGFETTLDDTLDACAADRECRADVSDPQASYDDLLKRLDTPGEVTFAGPDGALAPHQIDRAAFESAVDALLYEPSTRMLIQRAVAAAAHGDLVPAARLSDSLGSGEGVGISAFAYHAITCADYRVSPTSRTDDFAAVEAAGAKTGVDRLRTDEVFASQFPCLYWPYQPSDAARPAPLTSTPFPVFVLGATDDPITPIAGAERIADRLSDGYLIRTAGGPHVTFARGSSCVDAPILAFLLEGRRPPARTIECTDRIAGAYVALTPTSADDYADPLDAMAAAESEVFADPAYVLWDGQDEVRFGCRFGGFVAIVPETLQDDLRFADCSFAKGLTLAGTGRYVFAGQTVSWTVTAPDGRLDYSSTPASRSVKGTWKGKSIDLTR